MLFQTLWARESHHDLHAAVTAPPIHKRTSFSKKFKASKHDVLVKPMPMKKGLFVIGMSMLVYSGAASCSLDFYRNLSFLWCLRHAKQVDHELYYYTDFADYQITLAYFARVSVAIYTRIRPWIPIPGMETHDATARHFLALSRLEGDTQRRAHGVLHRACKDIHQIVKDFDEDITDPRRWGAAAPRMVFLLVEVMGDKAFLNHIHRVPSLVDAMRSGMSTPRSCGTVLETDTEEYY